MDNLPTSKLGQQDLSPFQVNSRVEVINLLRSMIESNQLISMLVHNSTEPVVTSVLKVDEPSNSVVIDCAANADANQLIIESDNISFETVLDNIRILFFSSKVDPCKFEKLPALRLDIPSSVIRLQRREFYRVMTPISNPLRCVIQIPRGYGEDTVHVTLQNVSGGGIGIIDSKMLLNNTVGIIYKDCQIFLPDNTVVVTSLQIRNSHDTKLPNGRVVRRLGCLFIDLPKPMLAAIQRFITKLERDQNAKTAGRT